MTADEVRAMLAADPIPDEDKILYWMKRAKEAEHRLHHLRAWVNHLEFCLQCAEGCGCVTGKYLEAAATEGPQP